MRITGLRMKNAKINEPHWIAVECKDIRLTKGLSLLHVATLAGVHENSLQRFEAGNSSLNIDAIERVLELLGYEIDIHVK